MGTRDMVMEILKQKNMGMGETTLIKYYWVNPPFIDESTGPRPFVHQSFFSNSQPILAIRSTLAQMLVQKNLAHYDATPLIQILTHEGYSLDGTFDMLPVEYLNKTQGGSIKLLFYTRHCGHFFFIARSIKSDSLIMGDYAKDTILSLKAKIQPSTRNQIEVENMNLAVNGIRLLEPLRLGFLSNYMIVHVLKTDEMFFVWIVIQRKKKIRHPYSFVRSKMDTDEMKVSLWKHEGIPPDRQQYYVSSEESEEILLPDENKTIQELRIKNEDKFRLATKKLPPPPKVSDAKSEWNMLKKGGAGGEEEALGTVQNGINFEVSCSNPECNMIGRRVYVHWNHLNFNLKFDAAKLKCDKCNEVYINIHFIIMKRVMWRLYGRKYEDMENFLEKDWKLSENASSFTAYLEARRGKSQAAWTFNEVWNHLFVDARPLFKSWAKGLIPKLSECSICFEPLCSFGKLCYGDDAARDCYTCKNLEKFISCSELDSCSHYFHKNCYNEYKTCPICTLLN